MPLLFEKGKLKQLIFNTNLKSSLLFIKIKIHEAMTITFKPEE